jgi:L-threonylcarbamoyladenylate synthase
MAAMMLPLDVDREAVLSQCKTVIDAGGVIAYPTDTFYGLGVNPRNPRAVKKVFAIKGRKADQPILLLLHDRIDVSAWVSEVTPSALRLMARFWPGPLTLVFRAAPHVLPELTAGTGTIGLRVPGNDVTRTLLGSVGHSLTGTSANRSGRPSPRTAEEVLQELGDSIDLILDGGPAAEGRPSTVVNVTEEPPRLVRQGVVDVFSRW